jgi:hypothetical protein
VLLREMELLYLTKNLKKEKKLVMIVLNLTEIVKGVIFVDVTCK